MKITAIQMNSINDKRANLDAACALVEKAIAADKPDLIAFPEMMAFYGGSVQDKQESAENIPKGEATERLAALARKHKVFIHGGSIYEETASGYYNTSVAFDRDGTIIARYRKIHLFDITTPDGDEYKESNSVVAGDKVITYQAMGITIGCSICYDLRFAELYLQLVAKGAQLIMIPAAFTLQTGKDHWETLLRARAIETQCYVVAPAQSGSYRDDLGASRKSWGHSMIVDPWGHVIAQASDGVGWTSATVNANYIDKIRRDLPVANHRIL